MDLHGSFKLHGHFGKEQPPARLFTFPGGERHLSLPKQLGMYNITARLTSSDAIMDVVLAADAMRRRDPGCTIHLFAPYIPYGRQDRVAVPGEPLSIAAFASVLNTCKFSSVAVLDPHSDVTMAVINNAIALPIRKFHRRAFEAISATYGHALQWYVAPDAGAMKRYPDIHFTLYGTKHRNLSNGNIQSFSVHHEVINDEGLSGALINVDTVIIDDICDGGATFIKLAEALYQRGVRSVHLVVAHGIFSKGLEPLFDAGITSIHTTESLVTGQRLAHPKFFTYAVPQEIDFDDE